MATDTESSSRLSLYWFGGCPWCERVRAAIADLQLEVDERDVRSDASHAAALREATGRGTVPVLRIDSPTGTEWLAESADIVRRLYADHGTGRAPTFLASEIPQRLGILLGGTLLVGSLFAPDDAQRWLLMAAAAAWLLGTRAPLLRRLLEDVLGRHG